MEERGKEFREQLREQEEMGIISLKVPKKWKYNRSLFVISRTNVLPVLNVSQRIR
jgi:hypothetical protein